MVFMKMLENHCNVLLSSGRTTKTVSCKKLYGHILFFWTEQQWGTMMVKKNGVQTYPIKLYVPGVARANYVFCEYR